MFRKTLLAAAALGALSITALAPTTASAWGGGWGGGGWGGGFHHGFGGPRFYFGGGGGGGYDGCYRRRVIDTPWGPRVRMINVCAY